MTPSDRPGAAAADFDGQPDLSGSPLDAPRSRQAAAWTRPATATLFISSRRSRCGWRLTYHNPDAVSHRVRFLVHLSTPDGARTPVPGGEDIVGPAPDLGAWASVTTALSRLAQRLPVGSVVVDGVRQPYPQDVAFTPTDPLSLTVAPLTADTGPVLDRQSRRDAISWAD